MLRYTMYMRRNMLIFLGLLVALLPYLGFPYEYNKWVWTTAGFFIVFLVLLPRTSKMRRLEERLDEMSKSLRGNEKENDMPRSLHVERREAEDRAGMRIERQTILDTQHTSASPTSDMLVEQKVSVVRRRKKVNNTPTPSFPNYGSGNT